MNIDKPQIIADVTRDVQKYLGAPGEIRMGRFCPVWAAMTLKHLHRRGIRAVLQAGTAAFRMVAREHDDGTAPTHLSFVWDQESPMRAITDMLGLMPEMHVWCGIPDTGEIVDATTKYLPDSVKLSGFEWRNAPPPDFIWHNASTMPDGFLYRPVRDAIERAAELVLKVIHEEIHDPIPNGAGR